jgi:hypothetical protein
MERCEAYNMQRDRDGKQAVNNDKRMRGWNGFSAGPFILFAVQIE